MLEFLNHLPLPTLLDGIRKSLKSSVLQSFHISPQVQKTSNTGSKFSGIPYLPKSRNIPKDLDGNPMFFLAQINFSECPSLPHFPEKGILQFFISTSLTHYLVSEDIYQHYFKVRYYPNLLPKEELVTDLSKLPIVPPFNSPIQNEMSLTFQKTIEPVSAMDYRLKNYISDEQFQFQLEDGRTFEEYYFEKFLGAEHKIGGYPYFIYTDSRKDSNLLKRYDTLLLQIVSDDEQGIMWGDSGIIKFFINKEKLALCDFTDIYLHVEQY